MFSKLFKTKRGKLIFWISLSVAILIVSVGVYYALVWAAVITPPGVPSMELSANGQQNTFTVDSGTNIALTWSGSRVRTPCTLTLNGSSIMSNVKISGSKTVVATNTTKVIANNSYKAACKSDLAIKTPWIDIPIGGVLESKVDVKVNPQAATAPRMDIGARIMEEPLTKGKIEVLPGQEVKLVWDLINVSDKKTNVQCGIGPTDGSSKTETVSTSGLKKVTVGQPNKQIIYKIFCTRRSTIPKDNFFANGQMEIDTAPSAANRPGITNFTVDRIVPGQPEPLLSATPFTPGKVATITIEQGDKLNVTWASKWATQCTATDDLNKIIGGSLAMSSSKVIGPMNDIKDGITLGIKCTNKNGEDPKTTMPNTAKVKVNVIPKVKVDLQIRKSGADYWTTAPIGFDPWPVKNGTKVDLRWFVKNASSCNTTGGFPEWAWKTLPGADGSQSGLVINGSGSLSITCQNKYNADKKYKTGFAAYDSINVQIK